MKIYLSGPIFSDKDYKTNFLMFESYIRSICKKYALKEYEIMNPADFETHIEEKNAAWEDWIIKDLEILKHCDVLVYLPGYKNSYGAKIEFIFAKSLGIQRKSLYTFEELVKTISSLEKETEELENDN